jgi:hypothetical protein
VQVDPIKPKLRPPGTKLLKLKCDILLSTSAFRFNLRRYRVGSGAGSAAQSANADTVGRCWFTLSNPH